MKTIIKLLALVTILNACSGIKVTSDYDKSADFTKYKTYSFYKWEEESDKQLTRFDKERIENAVGNEMDIRGYKYVEGEADLTVSLFVVLEQKTSKTAYTNHFGAGGPGYYGYDDWDYDVGWGWGMGHSTTTYNETDYVDGTLVIDVFDMSNRKLIWQGVGAGTVDEDPGKRQKKMPSEIKQIFSSFPKPVLGKN